MDSKFIERMMACFERTQLAELHYTEGACSLRLRRDASDVPNSEQVALQGEELVDTGLTHEPQAAVESEQAQHNGEYTVRATMDGNFYRANAPGEAPFVEEGMAIEEGHTLCAIEAMKMLNFIEAQSAGTVVRILAKDGQAIERDTPLFVIRPEAH